MNIISRKKALEDNLIKYYTGKPCKRNHISERYTNNCMCIACLRELNNEFRGLGRYRPTTRKRYEKLCKDNPYRFLYDRAKRRAKIQGVSFDINPIDIKEIWPIDNLCPALGIELVINIGKVGQIPSSKFNSPSLDKINPALGYVKGNIAVISLRANQIKGNLTDSEDLYKVAKWMEKNS